MIVTLQDDTFDASFDSEKLIQRIWRVLYLERVLPRLIWLGLGLLLVVTLIFFDLWRALPHDVALGLLYGGGGLVSGVLLLSLFWRLPRRGDVESWLESVPGLKHNPLTTLLDIPANYNPDDATQHLWSLHYERALSVLARVKKPQTRLAFSEHDPFALRAPIILLFTMGLIISGGSAFNRLVEAFDPTTSGNVLQPDVIIWSSAPDYIKQADIHLYGEGGLNLPSHTPLELPEGSELVIFGQADSLSVRINGEALRPLPEQADGDSGYTHYALKDPGELVIASPGYDLDARHPPLGQWPVTLKPDDPPVISFTEDPGSDDAGSLTFSYAMSDDYGLSDIRAHFELVDQSKVFADPLFGEPELIFDKPEGVEDKASLGVSLLRHPWAGLEVDMQLVAIDSKGQESYSDIKRFVLPEIGFIKTIARAVIEQRQSLALSQEKRHEVASRLQLISLWPEQINDIAAFLSLKAVTERIVIAGAHLDHAEAVAQGQAYNEAASKEQLDLGVEGLKSSSDLLFEIALNLDGQTLESARAAMEEAFNNLDKALNRQASNEEIRALTENLRESVSRYMRALAVAGPEASPGGGTEEANQSMNDIEEAMRAIGQLGEMGEQAAARAVLKRLRSIIDNIQSVVISQGEADPNRKALDELGELLGNLRELKDKTEDQDQNSQQEQSADQGAQQEELGALPPSIRQLLQEQNDLNNKLSQFIDKLNEQGLLSDQEADEQASGQGGGEGESDEQASGQGGGEGESDEQASGQGGGQGGSDEQASGQGGGQGESDEQASGQGGTSAETKRALNRALQDALRSLEQGNSTSALEAQKQAIDRLRQLSEQLSSPGQPEGANEAGTGGTDPFGGPGGALGTEGTEIVNDILKGRISDIFDDLRKRLGRENLDPDYRDYLRRLVE